MSIACNMDQYETDGTCRQWTVDADRANANEVLRSIQDAWSATMRVPGRDQDMMVSFSNGMVAVMIAAGGDDFYDLVAREPQNGWVEFVHGGQPADHLRRHCIPIGEALTWVIAFLDNGGIALPDARWERQGDVQLDRA